MIFRIQFIQSLFEMHAAWDIQGIKGLLSSYKSRWQKKSFQQKWEKVGKGGKMFFTFATLIRQSSFSL
jgi:hypothetical protein